MPDTETTFTITVQTDANLDREAIVRLTRRLADQIRSLDFSPVESPRVAAPAGSRGGTLVDFSTLLVTGAVSAPLLTALVALVKAWLRRNQGTKVLVEIDGDRLEINGVSSASAERLVQEFQRNRSGDR